MLSQQLKECHLLEVNEKQKCNKMKYFSERDAYNQLERMKHINHMRPEVRAYKCPICGCWHLTKLKWFV